MLKLSDSKTDTRILLEAISKNKIHLARFILDALDGKIVDSDGEEAQTPLISAVFLQDPAARSRFMTLLLQRGASVNRPDERGRTALSYACEMGFLDAVQILVRSGADPEAADLWGNTALMYAVAARHPATVAFLVRAFKRLGLQIDRQNKVGNSAIELAKHLGHTECLKALSRKNHEDSLSERLSGVSIDEDGAGTRERSPGLRNRIQSLDSIEEYERESGASSSQIMFAGVPTSQTLQKRERLSESVCPQPPALFYSPRPSKTPPAPSGPLGILLTPFGKSTKTHEKSQPIRRLDDRYYQKRCSLPTSALGPERSRSKAPVHAGKQSVSPVHAGKRSVSPVHAGKRSVSRMLRRFTFPELKPEGCGARSGASAQFIPRSETFPLGKHPPVRSKPSIDSISAVQCEFDSQAPDV